MLSTESGRTLLATARSAIASALGLPAIEVDVSADELKLPGASFVTLTQTGRLRGCIGSLQAQRSLVADVQANAVSAALRDPRFSPLQADAFSTLHVEVSVLSPPEPIRVYTEQALITALRPGVDGVILSYGPHRSTFLPQVWEQLPEPVDFLAQLKRKAGLPVDFWSADIQWQRYTVQKFSEDPAALL